MEYERTSLVFGSAGEDPCGIRVIGVCVEGEPRGEFGQTALDGGVGEGIADVDVIECVGRERRG